MMIFYVTQNPALHDVDGLRRIWFDTTATLQYYPVVHSVFWVQYHLWGLQPLGYHLINVLLHIVGALLLWRIMTCLNFPGAWLVAAIFALHPVEAESVAWVTELKNVLSAVFYFSAGLCYLHFAGLAGDCAAARRRYYYAAALVLFVGALLSKTVTCSLPAALALVVWWKKDRWLKELYPLAPFFLVGIALGLASAWFERHQVHAQGGDWSFTFADRILIAGRAMWFYPGKIFWPSPLTFIYPRWVIAASVWWQWLFPAGALVVVGGLWAARRRIGRGALVAVLFFGGTVLPALGFANVYPMRFSFVADHFQYLASLGMISLGVAIAAKFFETVHAEASDCRQACIAPCCFYFFRRRHLAPVPYLQKSRGPLGGHAAQKSPLLDGPRQLGWVLAQQGKFDWPGRYLALRPRHLYPGEGGKIMRLGVGALLGGITQIAVNKSGSRDFAQRV